MQRIIRRFAAMVLLLAAATAGVAGAANAQDSYPNHAVRWLVGYPPGGSTDICARLIGSYLSQALHQQFIVENRPGAGNNLATEMAAHAPPDGYTVFLVNPANAINATLYKNLPFDFLRDMAPVAGFIRVPNVMEVNPNVPANTVKEFIDYAKANPGKISFASSGVGASPHLSGAYFQFLTKIDMVHVPYRGSAGAYPDLMSGKVQVLFDNLGGPVLQMVHAGQLRALAVTSAERWPLLPDLPTVAETVPGYEVNVWYCMFAPKNTPANIVNLLNTGLKNAIAEPAIKARFAEDGGAPLYLTPEDLAKFVADDEANWHKMVEAAGISAE